MDCARSVNYECYSSELTEFGAEYLVDLRKFRCGCETIVDCSVRKPCIRLHIQSIWGQDQIQHQAKYDNKAGMLVATHNLKSAWLFIAAGSQRPRLGGKYWLQIKCLRGCSYFGQIIEKTWSV